MPDEPMAEGDDAEGDDADASAEPPLRRSRLGLAMVVVATMLLLAAVPLVVIGVGARSDASDARAATTRARAARVPLVARRADLEKRRKELGQLVNAVPDAVTAISTATRDVVDANAHFTEVSNQAIQRYNTGDQAGGLATYRTDGAAAIEQLQQKVAALQQAIADEKTALEKLRGTK